MSFGPDVARSVNGVPIRLTDERWEHIIEEHEDLFNYRQDLLDAIEQPDAIFQGWRGSLIAIRGYRRRGHLAVFYREVSRRDGFVITARFLRTKPRTRKLWPKR